VGGVIDGFALLRRNSVSLLSATSNVTEAQFTAQTSTQFEFEDFHLAGSPSDRRGDFSLTRKGEQGMITNMRAHGIRIALSFLVVAIACTLPSPSRAAWVNSNATQFQVGGKLTEIVPTLVSTAPGIANSPPLVNPSCGTQGGTSLALVRGSKLAGVDPVAYPIAVVVSCLDSNVTNSSRLNFINPITLTQTNGTVIVAAGVVVKQISTLINGVVAAPSNGWAHLVHRPDKGDLLGCGNDGTLYSIDYSQTNSVIDGTATRLVTPALGACGGLAWDAENDTIYQGVPANGKKIGSVARFKEGAPNPDATFTTNLSCEANGLAISGGVVLVSCAGLVNSTLVIQRLDKNTGANLGLYSSISLPVPGTTVAGFAGLTAISPSSSDPGLGDLACDPVTFQKDPSTGRDVYRDALWSRRGINGNGVAAVEFPAFTCGLPSASVVVQNGVSFSPLAAGLSAPGAAGPGQMPLASCFDNNGIVIDTDGDGLPDCWEANSGGSAGPGGGIDFDGDGTRDFTLCAQVNINGDGTTLTTECADPKHKDLFVEIGWMANHQPDPLALSQTQSVTTVGVQSVREAFGAAPVSNPDSPTPNGIRLHMQVDKQAVTFLNFTGTTLTSHVTSVAITPCTSPASAAPSPDDAADYDAIRATNFGMFDTASPPPSTKALNAMRLAVRYVLFGHNLVGNPSGGSTSSGCSEIGGDDAVVSLGSFASTTVNGIFHGRGTTDQQAGTFMHEFGHLLGFNHGGEDAINNKPNYRSVMSYSRQFSGSPISGRRLDYSRSDVIDLNEANLNECIGVGPDPTLGPILPFFLSPDQIAFGPGAMSLATPSTVTVSSPCTAGQLPVNWNRASSGKTVFQTNVSADINGDLATTTLFGFNDWANVLYRFSASVDFGGGRSETLTSNLSGSEMTKENETDFFLRKDVDGNGIGDGRDCGGTISTVNGVPTNTFPCTHRIDIKPSFPFPKTIILGTEATVTIAIFSETNGSNVWDATKQLVTLTNGCTASTAPCLTFSIENVVDPVKTNQNGQGTCSAQDVADPITGQKDGIKDLKCQFATSGLPHGTHFGVVSGFFVDPLDNNTVKAFSARQEVTILP
jgi:hypothetical protein